MTQFLLVCTPFNLGHSSRLVDGTDHPVHTWLKLRSLINTTISRLINSVKDHKLIFWFRELFSRMLKVLYRLLQCGRPLNFLSTEHKCFTVTNPLTVVCSDRFNATYTHGWSRLFPRWQSYNWIAVAVGLLNGSQRQVTTLLMSVLSKPRCGNLSNYVIFNAWWS